MIKAIQTQYRNYNFRSRVEARWAVWFDAMGITWEYEKEGYNLSRSGYYLPDFFIHDFDCYAEVKATEPSKNEWSKCEELAHALDRPVLMLVGTPADNIHAYVGDISDGSAGTTWRNIMFIDEACYLDSSHPEHGKLKWVLELDLCPDSEPGVFANRNDSKEWTTPSLATPVSQLSYDKSGFDGFSGRMFKAEQKARSARFEHGECP